MGGVSNKAECPGCKAYTSTVWDAWHGERDACGSCGLAGEVIAAVYAARKSSADEALAAKYEGAVVRAGRAEAALRVLHGRLEEVRQAMAPWPEEEKELDERARRAGWGEW